MASENAPNTDERWRRLISEHRQNSARRAAYNASPPGFRYLRHALVGFLALFLMLGAYASVEMARWHDPHRCDAVLPRTRVTFWSEGWGNGDWCAAIDPDGEVSSARLGAGPPVRTSVDVTDDNLGTIGAVTVAGLAGVWIARRRRRGPT